MTPLPKHLEEMRDKRILEFVNKHFEQRPYTFRMEIREAMTASWNQAAALMLKDMESMAKALEMIKDKAPFCDCMDAPAIANDALKIWREKYE